jgi:hypothetical protein
MTHLVTTDLRIYAAKQEIAKIDSIIQQLAAEGKSTEHPNKRRALMLGSLKELEDYRVMVALETGNN